MPSAAQCPADDRISCTHRNMAEKDIEKLCLKERVDLSDKKTRTKWSADEETCLISAVLDREDVLFGEFKGPGGKSGVAKRRQGWEEVADVLIA